MLELQLHVARLYLRVVKHLRDILDRATGHTNSYKLFHPFTTGSGPGPLTDLAHQLLPMRNSLRVVLKTRIYRNIRTAQNFTQTPELSIVTHGDHYLPITRRERLVRRKIRVILACSGRNITATEVVKRLICQPTDLYIKQSHIDVLALTCLRPVMQCRQDRNRCIHPGGQVSYRHANSLRAGTRVAVGNAGNAHQTSLCLHQVVIAGVTGHWTCLTETGD